jgi:hypothetical protein
MKQETQHPLGSRVWDDRATELRKTARRRLENADVLRAVFEDLIG